MTWKTRAAALVAFLFLPAALAGAEEVKKTEITDRIVRTQPSTTGPTWRTS